jgi:dTDP-4-dehydrorhamnose reductase
VSRWLVTGAGGMLGRDLVAALAAAGEEVAALTRLDLDITDETAVGATVRAVRPDVVVNCAAWTAVDDAESDEARALRVNGHGPAYLAAACAGTGARLVQVSTDYVFAGDARRPYAEHDPPSPRNGYGRTKLAGEQAVARLLPQAGYVVRTAWLYGEHGRNFVATVIRLERERPVIEVVADQQGQPTWAADVARQIITLIQSGAPPGIYHATSSGETSWFGLAREVFRLLGADEARVRPVPASGCPRPAPRPAYSVLGHGRWIAAGIEPIGDWREALRRAFPRLAAIWRGSGSP